MSSTPAQPQPTLTDKLAELFAGNEDAVNAFLLGRQQIKSGQTWRDLPPDYAQRVLTKPQDFLKAVADLNANGGAK